MPRMCAADLPLGIRGLISKGTVIPAHPLALDADRKLDARAQRALTRYYLDAGVGGLAVGVHTTQVKIRNHGLYAPVLELAAETTRNWTDRPVALVAGVTGDTQQAVSEASTARELGYHAALLNLAVLRGHSVPALLAHCSRIAEEMPLIGFSLLPEVGGFHLPFDFWRAFAEIENVVAIKMAPFNRYRTVDIARAVAEAGAEDRVTLYTGNDDHIVLDLLTPLLVKTTSGRRVTMRVRGGLLGQWSVWTKRAVELLAAIHDVPDGHDLPFDLVEQDAVVTDCNGAIYDAAGDFRGAIPGCLEVLKRQGLLSGTWCLDPRESLSAGQADEIDRVYRMHPEMSDDDFVRGGAQRWLSGPSPATLIPQ